MEMQILNNIADYLWVCFKIIALIILITIIFDVALENLIDSIKAIKNKKKSKK